MAFPIAIMRIRAGSGGGGGGGGGPFATWNTSGFGGTLSNGDRTISRGSGTTGACRSTSDIEDLTYFECSFAPAADAAGFGVCNASMSLTLPYLGQDANGAGYYLPSADVFRSAAAVYNGSTYSSTPVTGGMAFRGSIGAGWSVWVRRPDSTWEGGGDPVANTSPTFTLPAGTYFPACTITTTSAMTINAGQVAFVLWTPSGGFAGVPL